MDKVLTGLTAPFLRVGVLRLMDWLAENLPVESLTICAKKLWLAAYVAARKGLKRDAWIRLASIFLSSANLIRYPESDTGLIREAGP
jgi:hypothetical protein